MTKSSPPARVELSQEAKRAKRAKDAARKRDWRARNPEKNDAAELLTRVRSRARAMFPGGIDNPEAQAWIRAECARRKATIDERKAKPRAALPTPTTPADQGSAKVKSPSPVCLPTATPTSGDIVPARGPRTVFPASARAAASWRAVNAVTPAALMDEAARVMAAHILLAMRYRPW